MGNRSDRSQGTNTVERQRMLVLAIIGVVVALIIGAIVGRHYSDTAGDSYRNVSTLQYGSAASAFPANDPLAPQIFAVAEQFLCGCGQCGEMILAECVCDMPNGGINEKAFIRQKLVEGHNIDHVTQMVAAQFGRRRSMPIDQDRLPDLLHGDWPSPAAVGFR